MNKIETILGELGDVTHEIATKEEAEAGTSNSKYMTPLRVNEAINANIIFGTYVGDDAISRFINLGFTPKAGHVEWQNTVGL